MTQLRPEDQRDPARGARIRERRQQLKLTQAQVAQQVGITGRAYYEWENRGGPMSRGNLHLLAEALDTTPSFLLTGERFDEDSGIVDRVGALESEVERLTNADPRQTIDALSQRIDALEATVDRLVQALDHALSVLADVDEQDEDDEDDRRRAARG